MKGGNKLFLFAGVGLALVAVLLGVTMLSGDQPADAKKQDAPAKTTVIRLLQDIEPHTVIKPELIEQVEMDATEAPADAVTNSSAVLNQSYTTSAAKGDVLLASFVAPPGITASIEPGMRAISLEVDAQGAMSGLIMPGDHIDVVFKARVDLRKILDVYGIELDEDGGPYRISSSGGGGSTDNEEEQDGLVVTEGIESVFQGKDGGEFLVTDGGQNLEPVAKMLVQDIKVIRVIPPGVEYDSQGQQVQVAEEGQPAEEQRTGQLIVQVTPQQAEAVAFMQDQYHSFAITVRGKDDHDVVVTTGITFEILMSDQVWSMPWPEPVQAQEARAQHATPVAATPGAAATPLAQPATDDELANDGKEDEQP
jgi:Flp pilus assembly protein CpaB